MYRNLLKNMSDSNLTTNKSYMDAETGTFNKAQAAMTVLIFGRKV